MTHHRAHHGTRRRARRRARRWTGRGGAGFTLVEVLTAVTVLALVMGPLASAAVMFAAHGGDATQNLADVGTVRTATLLFVADGESADVVVTPDPSPCGSSNPALVSTTWDDAGTVYRASWFADASGATVVLVRRRCTGTSLVSTVVVGDLRAAPSIACTPACDAPDLLSMTGTTLFGLPFTVTAHRRPS